MAAAERGKHSLLTFLVVGTILGLPGALPAGEQEY